jgi:hypothetical protein
LQSASKKGSKSPGRPTKKTTEIVGKLIDAFHDDATIEQACYYSGIDKSTYYEWLKEDDSFSYEMAKAQEYPKVLAKRVLIQAMLRGDEKTALEVIKRREKDRYSERSELTGKDGDKLIPTPIMGGTAGVSKD